MKCAIAFSLLLAVGAAGAWTAYGALMASPGASTALEVAQTQDKTRNVWASIRRAYDESKPPTSRENQDTP